VTRPAILPTDPESVRLDEDGRRERNWKRWGPYLSERQWGTVREDYSADGSAWNYFPHDHARSRAYRWGEDGLLGICDRQGRLCFALALWNGRDPILKERLFGLAGPEGNHGEDVKECYYYLDSTPTHSYMKALYKYPQREFPYAALIEENRRRGRLEPEFELADTGIFDGDRYFDVFVEYAKRTAGDILIRITVANRAAEAAKLHVLPTLWFRNSWSWGRSGEGYWPKPRIRKESETSIGLEHESLGAWRFEIEPVAGSQLPELLFTGNETNSERLWGAANSNRYVKDAFHRHVIQRETGAVSPEGFGTKAAVHHRLEIPAKGEAVIRLRLFDAADPPAELFGGEFDRVFENRKNEADLFYAGRMLPGLSNEERNVVRQGYAGLLWTKQFYFYVVKHWLEGDPAMPPPPAGRKAGRNRAWKHVYNRDVISMPDKWEYPWYAAWDTAFHMIPFARIDPYFTKAQLVLFLREWYMQGNGQLPAYEWALGDANPPVHAWAAWRVYKMTGPRGGRDRMFLERVFQKLMLNFTWWVNQRDAQGNNLFGGGFLGLDNISLFDRSTPLPGGANLEQADGTAWMAFYCGTMLAMALELAKEDPVYEDVASKFFEHFVAIVDAMNSVGGSGLWDEQDGFYYDQIQQGGRSIPLRVRSMVGIIPLFAVENLEQEVIDSLPGFARRMKWFLENRPELASHISYLGSPEGENHSHRLLAIPSKERLLRVLRYLLDENEFLSPHGIRSLSQIHRDHPCILEIGGEVRRVEYVPGDSTTELFGGNSNWRGPIWAPVSFLLAEALERYGHFYGETLKVECPTGSGRMMSLSEVSREITARVSRLFLPDAQGNRPSHGGDERYAKNPDWRDLVLFYECFDGDTGRGIGATHQTGWSALAIPAIEESARRREKK